MTLNGPSSVDSRVAIFHQNICGLKTNGDLLLSHIQYEPSDIICLSEHNLRPTEFDNFVIDGYCSISAFCCSSRMRGGVCILSRSHLCATVVDVSDYASEQYCHMTAAVFELVDGSKLLILAVYRPHTDCDQFIDLISHCLDALCLQFPHIIVLGDFNINILSSNFQSRKFLHAMTSYGLRHTITSFTRESKHSKTAIDNIFTNIIESNINSRVVKTALSDHHGQEAVLNISALCITPHPTFRYIRSLSPENVQTFRFYLKNEDWMDILVDEEFNNKFNAFFKCFRHHFDVCFPLKKTKLSRGKSSAKIPISNESAQLRNRLLNLYSITRDLDSSNPLLLQYKELRKLYKKSIRIQKSRIINEKISNSSNKVRVIWDIINDHKPSKHLQYCHISLNDSCGVDTDNPSKVANLFNSAFLSVSQHSSKNNRHSYSNASLVSNFNSSSMFLLPTTSSEVIEVISSLKPKKSTGFDEISTYLLKQVSDLIAPPLTFLINLSLAKGEFPDILKHAIIKPLHKKGSKCDVNNYRPISLLSCLSKVFERIFNDRLQNFLFSNKIISPQQFGFIKNKNTADAMICLISSIVESLDIGRPTVGMFFDLTKAFDMVDHNILLDKLSIMGIRGVSLAWIASYLSGRTQTVRVPFVDSGGCLRMANSSSMPVTMGVPQGSVLGPILFLLFINDLPQCISDARVCLFADDTSLMISACNREELEMKSYIEASSLHQWLSENNLILNTAKSHAVEFYINNRFIHDSLSIFVDDSELESCSSVKFLGLVVDSNLNYYQHVDAVCKRLSSGIYMLKKLSTFANTDVLLTAYYGLIYPFLSYGVAVWGHENYRTKHIFRLQKKVIRIIFNKPFSFSCKPLFKLHNILTFSSIYILNVLIFVRKNFHLYRVGRISERYNLRNNNNIRIPFHRTTFYERQLLFNGARLYNALPDSLKKINDIKIFSKKVKDMLMSQCHYSVSEYLNKIK